ncbi:hypothetical protein DGWBC_1349 [Dehalogenimonas sp. WBC-2]|nr:hypothetical protein DGWBC_1349 [Dehalogenimonas sp. WBC-2]
MDIFKTFWMMVIVGIILIVLAKPLGYAFYYWNFRLFNRDWWVGWAKVCGILILVGGFLLLIIFWSFQFVSRY